VIFIADSNVRNGVILTTNLMGVRGILSIGGLSNGIEYWTLDQRVSNIPSNRKDLNNW
jgi:hypothetical protein